MSRQWNMSNGDQRGDRHVLEQLWYTWSAVGLGPLSAGFRIRAASRGLSDVSSPRVQALDRYLRYVLPAGTDPFAITPDMAPICLSLIQTEQGERILVSKTYTGKDGVGRPGAFFVHLLANLPPDFSAAQAISLWRSPFLRSSDIDPSSGVQQSGVQLDSIPFSDLKQWLPREVDIMHPKGINSSWVYDCFPLVIRAYLMWRKRWEQWWQNQQSEPPRLYIAAPSDLVAAFISGITRCLPPQLLTNLTFSTYEHDVRSKGQVQLLGTAWPPSPDGKINTNQDLPAVCYQEGVAINCYNYDETKTRLERDPLAISFAAYATQCLAADNFLELDWLFAEKTPQTPNLNVSGFLQTYDSYIVKAQNPTQKDVELYLDNADAELLSRIHVQSLILTIAALDPRWLNGFLKPHLTVLFKQSKANPKLARALAQLAKAATQKAAEAVSAEDITILNAMLSVVVQTADSQSEAWRIQPRIFAAQPNIQSFLTKHPNATFQLLEFWNQLSPPLSINEVRPFLDVSERNFEAFYSRNLPLEWKYIATQALVTSAIAQNTVPILGQKYQRPVAALMQHLSQSSSFEAVDLFEKLAKEGYPDKIGILSILLGAPTSIGKESELLNKAYLKDSEREKFLLQYGPQYLLSPQKEAIVLKLFKTFAKDVPTRKMFVLDNWLKSPSLLTWFEAPSTGPGNLDKVLEAASLGPDESNAFIESYSRRYLERFSQQPSTYRPSLLILGYLKRYLDSFNPKSLWQPSSAARKFLLFLGNSPLRQTLPEREQLKVQQWYGFGTFLQQPSTRMADVKVLGRVLHELRLNRDLLLIERLAEAFASCIESATELASVTYMMSTLITETELLQMLYTMAECIRDNMVDPDPLIRQRAGVVLQAYIQFALCFDSIYDLSSEAKKIAIGVEEIQPAMKEKLFLQTFLYVLLQNASPDLMNWLDERPSQSRRQYWQKWDVYKPLRNRALAPTFQGSSLASRQSARSVQQGGQSHYNLGTFLAHPSTARKEVETLRNMLPDRRSTRNTQAIESLAVAFASCIESETELTAVIKVLSPFVTKSSLLQMLYAMAENIREDLADSEKKQFAEAPLDLYIRFILCFESVYELSPDEHALFVRTFLNLLLQSADDSTFQKLNTRNWPDKLLHKWQAYMPQHYAQYLRHHNGSGNREGRSSSTAAKQPSYDFFSAATALSPQEQEASTSMMPSFSEWFTRLIAWLAENTFARSRLGLTKLKRQKKVTNNRR